MPEARIDANLVAELERLSLDVIQRLRRRADEVTADPVAADELFVIAGQLEAALGAALERVRVLREALDRAAREDHQA